MHPRLAVEGVAHGLLLDRNRGWRGGRVAVLIVQQHFGDFATALCPLLARGNAVAVAHEEGVRQFL